MPTGSVSGGPADARLQGPQPPLPSRRVAGRTRRAAPALALTLAFVGMVGALAAVPPASVAAGAVVVQAVKLPPGFPKSVPLPKRATELGTADTKLGDEPGVNFAVKGTISAVAHAYEKQLKAAGFKVKSAAPISASGTAIQAAGHGWDVDATLEPGSLLHLKAGECYLGIDVTKS